MMRLLRIDVVIHPEIVVAKLILLGCHDHNVAC